MGRGVEDEARQEESEQCSSRRGGGSHLRVPRGAAQPSGWRLRPQRALFYVVALAAAAVLAGRAGAVGSGKLAGLQTPASHLRARKTLGEGYGQQVRYLCGSFGPWFGAHPMGIFRGCLGSMV